MIRTVTGDADTIGGKILAQTRSTDIGGDEPAFSIIHHLCGGEIKWVSL